MRYLKPHQKSPMLAACLWLLGNLALLANPQLDSRITITDVAAAEDTIKEGALLLDNPKIRDDKYQYLKRIDVADTKPKLSLQIWEKILNEPIWHSEGPPLSIVVVVTLDGKRVSAMLLAGVERMTDLWAALDNDRVFLYVDSFLRFGPDGVFIHEVSIKTGNIKEGGVYFSRERLAEYYARIREVEELQKSTPQRRDVEKSTSLPPIELQSKSNLQPRGR
jgi:hypothetical protein